MKAQMPEMPRERRNRLKGEWGFNDLEMRDVLNADALDLLEEHRQGRRFRLGRQEVVAGRAVPRSQRQGREP